MREREREERERRESEHTDVTAPYHTTPHHTIPQRRGAQRHATRWAGHPSFSVCVCVCVCVRLSYPLECFDGVGCCDRVAVNVGHCRMAEQLRIECRAQVAVRTVLRAVTAQPHHHAADSKHDSSTAQHSTAQHSIAQRSITRGVRTVTHSSSSSSGHTVRRRKGNGCVLGVCVRAAVVCCIVRLTLFSERRRVWLPTARSAMPGCRSSAADLTHTQHNNSQSSQQHSGRLQVGPG